MEIKLNYEKFSFGSKANIVKTKLDGIFATLFMIFGCLGTFIMIATEFELADVHVNPQYWMLPAIISFIGGFICYAYLAQEDEVKSLAKIFISPKFYLYVIIILLLVPRRW